MIFFSFFTAWSNKTFICLGPKNNILDDYTIQLLKSGYSEEDAKDILTNGIKGYERKVRNAAEEGTPLHRPGGNGEYERNLRRITIKTNWFKLRKKASNSVSDGGCPGQGTRHYSKQR